MPIKNEKQNKQPKQKTKQKLSYFSNSLFGLYKTNKYTKQLVFRTKHLPPKTESNPSKNEKISKLWDKSHCYNIFRCILGKMSAILIQKIEAVIITEGSIFCSQKYF